MEDTGSFLAPALLTGTSGEYMGRKPLPRLLRERHVVFVLGPQGVGKSTVARRLAGNVRVDLDTQHLEHALLDRVRSGKWSDGITGAPSLLVDGPVWLRTRIGALTLLLELARNRADQGRRTVFCQAQSDGSVEELITLTEPGSAVVVGLRFPSGTRSRLRCARQLCRELSLPIDAADGSELLEPWRYDRVVAFLVERAWRRP
jgi:hypothetical protein